VPLCRPVWLRTDFAVFGKLTTLATVDRNFGDIRIEGGQLHDTFIHWSHARHDSRLWFVLLGCSETRTVSARSVLNTCIPINANDDTRVRDLESTSVLSLCAENVPLNTDEICSASFVEQSALYSAALECGENKYQLSIIDPRDKIVL